MHKVTITDSSVFYSVGSGNDNDNDNHIAAMCYPLSNAKDTEDDKNKPMLLFTIFRSAGNAGNQYNQVMEKGFLSSRDTIEQTLAVIMLPMPINGINDTISNTIDSRQSSLIQEMISNGMADMNNSGVENTIKNGIATITNEIGININRLSGAYNTNTGGKEVISGNRGIHAYQGTEPRTFIFNYRLYPKSVAELKEIGAIVRTFQRSALPSLSGSKNGYSIHVSPPLITVREVIKGDRGVNNRYTALFGSGVAQISNVRVLKGDQGVYGTLAGTKADPNLIDLEITIKEIVPPTTGLFDEIERGTFGDVLMTKSKQLSNTVGDWKKIYSTLN